jgi:hypothetical protein
MSSRTLSLFLIGLCLGCSNRTIVRGALTALERQEYVEQTGALIPQRLKAPFLSGNAAEGMTKEMIIFLYGQPHRTENNHYGFTWSTPALDTSRTLDTRDSLWNYFSSDSGSVKIGMAFRGDTLVHLTGLEAH